MAEKVTKGEPSRDPRIDAASGEAASKRTVPEMPAAGAQSPIFGRPFPPKLPEGSASKRTIPEMRVVSEGGAAVSESVLALTRQVAELKAALAKERAERAEDDNRMGGMLARVAEREAAASAAEKRAERALSRIQVLETELANAGVVANVLDEQLQATGAGFASSGRMRLADAGASGGAVDANRRAELAERERDALREEVARLRERMDEMRGRTEAMTDALEGLKRAVQRATIPPRG
jgi:chromosome segregation ATPase